MKQGDRVKVTREKQVMIGEVTFVSGVAFDFRPDYCYQELRVANGAGWNVEVLTPEIPEGFKKQGAKIADANDQHWYLFDHNTNLWMSVEGEDEILHWNYLAKPVHLLEIVATYPPES